MLSYPDTMTVREGLHAYFSYYGFHEGGYNDKWFRIKFWGPVTLVLPNIKARVDAVKIHDIHHLLTEYEANLRGEAEIGAWELAAGCGKYYIAWLLNFGALLHGLVLWPGYIYRAFIFGRKCRSLYYRTYDERLLSSDIGSLRNELGLKKSRNKRWVDDVSFGLWVLLAAAAWLAIPVLLILILA
jgi:hypothetical protein